MLREKVQLLIFHLPDRLQFQEVKFVFRPSCALFCSDQIIERDCIDFNSVKFKFNSLGYEILIFACTAEFSQKINRTPLCA